jgi:hypothetical protein
MEWRTVFRLSGALPGYMGYDEGCHLTERGDLSSKRGRGLVMSDCSIACLASASHIVSKAS